MNMKYDENYTVDGWNETAIPMVNVSDDVNVNFTKKPAGSMVNHPAHYNQGGVECIEAIRAATINLTGEEAFDTGSAIKYLWRWHEKNGIEDLEKAKWYIDRIIKKLGENK